MFFEELYDYEIGKGFDNDNIIWVMSKKNLGGDEFVIGQYLLKILFAKDIDFFENFFYDGYFGEEFLEEQIVKQLDLDIIIVFMFDYYLEEGKWKFFD